jgi:hypothetical protein
MAAAETKPGPYRLLPLSIPPQTPAFLPVSARKWQWIHEQLQPPRRVEATSSYCLHVLRVHGPDASFPGKELDSGAAILHVLTDDTVGQRVFGRPALVRTPHGVRFPTGQGRALATDRSVESHRDHTLAAFAELGLPLTYPVRVGDESLSLADALRDSIANFHLQQQELAWTALAYALYLPPAKEWTNRFGETFSFDSLVNALLDSPLEGASCGGTHLLYTLTILLRADQGTPILTMAVRRRLTDRLALAVHVAQRTQMPEGWWAPAWNSDLLPGGHPREWTPAASEESRLLMTGHLAEWLLYLPGELQPSPGTLRRAGQWLLTRLEGETPAGKTRQFCPCAHAACALRHLACVSASGG